MFNSTKRMIHTIKKIAQNIKTSFVKLIIELEEIIFVTLKLCNAKNIVYIIIFKL